MDLDLEAYNVHVLLVFLQYLYPLVRLNKYSHINLLWLVVSIVYPQLSSYVFVNSLAIAASFYTGLMMLDDEDTTRFMGNMTPVSFHVGSIVVHVLPAVVSWYCLPKRVPTYVGFVTMFHHLAWGFYKNSHLCLDSVYIPMIPRQWHIMWYSACAIHIVAPFMFSRK